LTLNGGPFPPPALPDFRGTMGLSDSPCGPACPSRASGWFTHPPRGVSRVALDLRVQPCRRPYPGGIAGGSGRSPDTCDSGLPHPLVGSAPTLSFSRPARRSRKLRPGCSRGCLCSPFHPRLRHDRYLPHRSDCYRLERPSCRVGLAPTEDQHLFTAHKGTRTY
jgi:hypothetical protein